MSNQWISVEKRFPEIEGLNVSVDCLVKSAGKSFKGYYHYRHEKWYCLEPPFDRNQFRELENVTHWKPQTTQP